MTTEELELELETIRNRSNLATPEPWYACHNANWQPRMVWINGALFRSNYSWHRSGNLD